MTFTLKPQLLTRERFAPFGEVIETSRGASEAMNAEKFERFDDLCHVEFAEGGRVAVSIARCRTPTSLPLRLEMLERHPLGSQAFIPLGPCKLFIVVAPPTESVGADALRAFVSNGRQGINYRRGTWHMPLISFTAGQEYLVIDRGGDEPNCEQHTFEEALYLEAD